MDTDLFLECNIRALGYKTNFSPVADEWVSPNSKILPEPEIRIGTQEHACAESIEIDIDLPDSVYDEQWEGVNGWN